MKETGTLRGTIAIRIVELGRRLFANTPVQRWSITTAVLRRVLRAGYGTGDVEAEFRGLRITVPAHDVTIFQGVVGGFYEELELDVFAAVARKCSLVVDVGGNIGLFTCVAASAMAAGGVVSFEPVPANLGYLRRNIELNGLSDRVEVVDRAVGDQVGTAPIYLSGEIGTNSLISAVARSADRIDVDVTTLDEWLGERPVDLLKIDAEGFDGHVVRGAKSLIERVRPTLFAEYNVHAMTAAGLDPTEMLRDIFDVYDTVFLIDEPKRIFRAVRREEIQTLSGPNSYWNLIAVANRAHCELVQAAAADFTA